MSERRKMSSRRARASALIDDLSPSCAYRQGEACDDEPVVVPERPSAEQEEGEVRHREYAGEPRGRARRDANRAQQHDGQRDESHDGRHLPPRQGVDEPAQDQALSPERLSQLETTNTEVEEGGCIASR